MWPLLCRLVCDNIMLHLSHFLHNSHTNRCSQVWVHQWSSSTWRSANFFVYIWHLKFFTRSHSSLRWQCSPDRFPKHIPHTQHVKRHSPVWIHETSCYSLTKFFQSSHSKMWFPSTGSSELNLNIHFYLSPLLDYQLCSLQFCLYMALIKGRFIFTVNSVALLGINRMSFK